jgi:hypothetical protein
MAGFVQTIEFSTTRIDEFRALVDRMRAERGDELSARRSLLTEDRDQPGRYVVVVEFDSYEDAMRNSNDPVTARYAGEMAALADSGPVFRNLDLIAVEI